MKGYRFAFDNYHKEATYSLNPIISHLGELFLSFYTYAKEHGDSANPGMLAKEDLIIKYIECGINKMEG